MISMNLCMLAGTEDHEVGGAGSRPRSNIYLLQVMVMTDNIGCM